jgi:phenylacetate-CoA ligase
MTSEIFSDEMKSIEKKERELLSALKSMLGISPKVMLVAPRTIARSEGKAVRIIDKRKI